MLENKSIKEIKTAEHLEGAARFQATLFLAASKNWAGIFSWLSGVLWVLLVILVVNDFIHYEVTELTEYTTENISVIVYVSVSLTIL